MSLLQMWGRALKIAETKMHARLAEVAATIGRRLQRLGQYEQAGELLLGAQDAKVLLLILPRPFDSKCHNLQACSLNA